MNDKRFIFLGAVEAGKTSLFNALRGIENEAVKTQALDYDQNMIDTPGEFFSYPRLYHALITTMTEVSTVIYVHAANDFNFRLPEGLLAVNEGKRMIAVITKTDLIDADPVRVRNLLQSHGFTGEIYETSLQDTDSIARLKTTLF